MKSSLFPLVVALAAATAHAADSAPTAAPAAPTASAPASATKDPAVVARVNGVPIPQLYFDLLKKERLAQGQNESPGLDKAIRDELVNRELIAQQSRARGLDKRPDVAMGMDLAQKGILVRAFLGEFTKENRVSEDALKAEYDKVKAQMGGNEFKARHILVETEKEAKDIIATLAKNKKAKFEDIAKKKSKDPSASEGGSLGWAAPANFVKEFADALNSLKKGETTKTPVKTQFGWHVMRVEDVRPVQFPSYEELKPRIAQELQQQQIGKLVRDLRATARIE